ncbi:MAG: type V CRISPR-associated protein Cas4 [Candidatus Iainarchaeum sp.]|jgi:CRISPR-associated exonuclease Cas4|nr:MAG: hypothetical protein BWY55_00350 [archaeon ADurb.Bin336]
MEENISISNLNDFIFCPRSIYFQNLYKKYDKHLYHNKVQTSGKNAHKSIDSKNYSSKKSILQGIDVYSEELGLIGKIDLFDQESKTLIERKNKIKRIYDGYYLQLYAQYYCLIEMGFEVNNLKFYSISDNKSYPVKIPEINEKNYLKHIIHKMRTFDLTNKDFKQNRNKCEKCIYRELCDYYDE